MYVQMAGMEDQFARFSKLYDALSFLLGGVVSPEPRAYSPSLIAFQRGLLQHFSYWVPCMLPPENITTLELELEVL